MYKGMSFINYALGYTEVHMLINSLMTTPAMCNACTSFYNNLYLNDTPCRLRMWYFYACGFKIGVYAGDNIAFQARRFTDLGSPKPEPEIN